MTGSPAPLHAHPSIWQARTVAQIVVVGALYYLAARFGLSFARVNESSTAIWPPSGLSLAAILLLGYRVWPGVFAGAAIANLVNLHQTAAAGAIGEPVIVAAALAVGAGNALEGLIGGWLVNRLARGIHAFESTDSIFRFILCGPTLAPAVSATVGVTSLALTGFAPWAAYAPIWFTWWLGDLTGMLIIGPLLVIWSRRPEQRLTAPRLIEAAALAVGVIAVGETVFGGWLPPPYRSYPLAFLCIPPMVWAAYRFLQHGATAVAVTLSGITLWGTLRGFGPFAVEPPNASLLLQQAFLGTVTVSMLLLAAAVTQQRREAHALSRARDRYRSLVMASTQLVWSTDAAGDVVEDIPSWRAFTGQTFEQLRGRGWMACVHPDDVARTSRIWEDSRAAGVPHENEFRVRRADGQYRLMLARAVPVRGADGAIIDWIGTSTDVTEVRAIERELRSYQQRLEEAVGQRTAELEATHQQLRLAERMAAMGTLAAGLGHDMGNLLLPIRFRIDVLESMNMPPEAHEQLAAIGRCVGHLQSLTRGVQFFAQEPAPPDGSGSTDLATWVHDVSPLYRSVLPRAVAFDVEIPPGLPAVRIAPQLLTHAILNLVNNAKEALADAPGRVVLRAELADGGAAVRIIVQDDGPGMTERVRARAFEPFFTTKSRSVSTGLGLSIVHGLIQSAGGAAEMTSPVADGRGTRATLTIPVRDGVGVASREAPQVAITVADRRLGAVLAGVLTAMGCSVVPANGERTESLIWFVDPAPERLAAARAYLKARPGRLVVAVGQVPREWGQTATFAIDPHAAPGAIRELVQAAVRQSRQHCPAP